MKLIFWASLKSFYLDVSLDAWKIDRSKISFMNETAKRSVAFIRPASTNVHHWLIFKIFFILLMTLLAVNIDWIFFYIFFLPQNFIAILTSTQRSDHELCHSSRLNISLLFLLAQEVKANTAKCQLWVLENDFGLSLLGFFIVTAVETESTGYLQYPLFGQFPFATRIVHNGLDFPETIFLHMVRK